MEDAEVVDVELEVAVSLLLGGVARVEVEESRELRVEGDYWEGALENGDKLNLLQQVLFPHFDDCHRCLR